MPLLPKGGSGGISEHNQLQGLQGGSAKRDEFYHLTKEQLDGLEMKYYRGVFPDANALRAAHPADEQGAYAVVLATETFWTWTTEWVDTGHASADPGVPPGGISGQSLTKRSDADGDVEWRTILGGGGTSDHEELENRLLLPDPEAPSSATWHVSDADAEWIRGARRGAPDKPQNITPVSGEYNVYQYAVFTGTAYVQTRDIPMYAMRIQIATDKTFQNIVYDQTLYQQSTRHKLDGTVLAADETKYWWRLCYQSQQLAWSAWSEPTWFVTEFAFSPNIILQPELILPSEGASFPPQYGILQSTGFATEGEPTLHSSSSWKINTGRDGQGTDLWNKTDSATDLITTLVDENLYSAGIGKTLYAGVQHAGANGNRSKWSPFVGFIFPPYYDGPVIGLEMDIYGSAMACRWIDPEGTPVIPAPGYFDNHAPWNAVNAEHVFDGNSFAFIRTFYQKFETLSPTKTRYWISPEPLSGFHIHPAFRNIGSESGFFFGRYISGNNASKPTSVPDIEISGQTPATWGTFVTNLVAATNGPYHIQTYYELNAVMWLVRIEGNGMNPSLKLGASPSFLTGLSNAKGKQSWRGIYDLWGTVPATKYLHFIGWGAIFASNSSSVYIGIPESPSVLIKTDFAITHSIGNANYMAYVTSTHSGIEKETGLESGPLLLPKTLVYSGGTPVSAAEYSPYRFPSMPGTTSVIALAAYSVANNTTLYGIHSSNNISTQTRLCRGLG